MVRWGSMVLNLSWSAKNAASMFLMSAWRRMHKCGGSLRVCAEDASRGRWMVRAVDVADLRLVVFLELLGGPVPHHRVA